MIAINPVFEKCWTVQKPTKTLKNKNLNYEEWYTWVHDVKSAYSGNPVNTDQCLLMHNAKKGLFIMYVIAANVGVVRKIKATNTRDIYKYLIDNYCNKPNTIKGHQNRINVYYSSHEVRNAMERGIVFDDGKRINYPRQKHNIANNVVAETTMFRCINLRWTRYYFGYTVDDTNDLINVIDDIKHRFEICPRDPHTFGFTSLLKRKLGIFTYMASDFNMNNSEESIEAQKMIVRNCNLGALMGAIRNTEFYNIYSYDIDSAYIMHLFKAEFPSNNVRRIPVDEYQIKRGYTHFMLARVTMDVKTVYAEKLWFVYPAGLVPQGKVEDGTITLTATNKIASCKDHIIGLWDEDIEILKEFYDVYEFEPICVFEYELKPLPDELKDTLMDLYKAKTAKKISGDNYHTEKIILNRGGYGFWVTKREIEVLNNDTDSAGNFKPNKKVKVQSDKNVPFQIGAYIVALQRKTLLNMMQKIGMDHVVAFHTDSIKTDINCDRIFDEYNSSISIYGKLGHFEKEWFADRCYFFNTSRYKANTNKGLIVKHGGIDKKEMGDVFSMPYDDITADTEIEIDKPLTKYINCVTGKLHSTRIITKMGNMEDWMMNNEGQDLLAI